MAINIKGNVTLDTNNYTNGLSKIEKTTTKTTTTIQNSFKGVANEIIGMGTAFVTFDKLIDFWKQSYIEAENARKEAVIFESIMNNTSRAYKNATKELMDYASALEEKTGIDSGEILKTQQRFALLENLTTDLIPKATSVTLDLATAMGTDLGSASTSLAKALEDPLDGLNALRRTGIFLSEEQEDIIKSLAESGKIYEAQSKLIEEVEKKVGGLAEQNKSTLDEFQTEWKKFLEEYGQDTKLVFEEMVIPILRKVLQLFKMVTGMSGESFMSSESWDKFFGVDEASASAKELEKAEKKVIEIKKKLDNINSGFMSFLYTKETKEKVKKELEDELKSAESRVKTLKYIEEQRDKKTKEEKVEGKLDDVGKLGKTEKEEKEAEERKKAKKRKEEKEAEEKRKKAEKEAEEKRKKAEKEAEERIKSEKKQEEERQKQEQKRKEQYEKNNRETAENLQELVDDIIEEKEKQVEREKELEEQKAKDLLEINLQYFKNLYDLNNQNRKEQDDLIKEGKFFQLDTLKRDQEFKKEQLKLQKDYDNKRVKEGDKFNEKQEYEKLQSSLEQLEIQRNQYIQEDIYRKNADEAFLLGKQSLNDTTGMLLENWIMGEWKGLKEYGRILTYQLQQELASMAQRNAVKALEQTAIGLAFLALGNPTQASLAFKSASAFASTAVIAGAGSFAVGSANRALGGKPNQEKDNTSKAISRTSEEKRIIENKTEPQELLIISKNDYQKYVRNTLLPEIQKALDNGKTLKVK